MPLRKFVSIFLFACTVLLLVAAAYTFTSPSSGTYNSRNATRENLREESREMIRSVRRYNRYARRAAEEHREDAARLFRAIALSDSIQQINQRRALIRLGGFPPIVFFEEETIGTPTVENLHQSLSDKREQARIHYPRHIATALSEGAQYAARILIWSEGNATKQALMLERITGQTAFPSLYEICPLCGNTFCEECHESYCPFCATHESRFLTAEIP